jgi:hypothetical protein
LRSEPLLALAAAAVLALAACSPTRGTGPNSIEVGGQCDEARDWTCEEVCLAGPSMCVFRCRTDSDCPAGSVCSGLFDSTSTAANRMYYCLPECATAPCGDYAQGLCCGTLLRSDQKTRVNVCYKAGPLAGGGQPFDCLAGGADAGR